MADVDDVARLEGLVRDLVALREKRLVSFDRLQDELIDRIPDFQNLIDNKPKSDASRASLFTGKIVVDGSEYKINPEFQAQTVRFADEFDLDELDAAALMIGAEQRQNLFDRSPFETSVLQFHSRRRFLLECLRLLFERQPNSEFGLEDGDVSLSTELANPREMQIAAFIAEAIDDCKDAILGTKDGDMAGPSKFWNRCFKSLDTVEKSIFKLSNKQKRLEVVNDAISPVDREMFRFQMDSLAVQHECLSAICCFLIQGGHCSLVDFKLVIEKIKSFEKHDLVLVHYIPIMMAFSSFFGGRDSSLSDEDVALVHEMLTSIKDKPWVLRKLHAAIMLIWLADYSGRDFGVQLVDETDKITQLFTESLKEGSLNFLLALSKDLQDRDWPDFATTGLLSVLLIEAPSLPPGEIAPSSFMRGLIMRYMQKFINSVITNLPDALRMLKAEEDENRRLLMSHYRRDSNDYDIHLEGFIVIVSYAYKGSPVAALDFWNNLDGNLYGFLKWIAERLTTPRAAAFCELLMSLSETGECANHAHSFLNEHSSSYSGRLRRSATLSWAQIFREMELYASVVPDRHNSNAPVNSNFVTGSTSHTVEPEAQLMIQCYLRMIAHMCARSPDARKWIMTDSKLPLVETLFQLCGTASEPSLRSSAFKVLNAVLTDKTGGLVKSLWVSLDNWIYMTNRWQSFLSADFKGMNELAPFVAVANTVEEADTFVELVNTLLTPSPVDGITDERLAFPENLGSSYRMPGVVGYVDFIVGKLFGELSVDLDPSQTQHLILRYKCLNLIHTCLTTFNDDLVIIGMLSNIKVDNVVETSSFEQYIKLHPFARVMEWLFNEKVLRALFQIIRQEIDEVNAASEDSPYAQSLTRAVQVLLEALKLQSTYLDFVRTFPKGENEVEGPKPVANMTLASIEDALLNNMEVVIDLALFAGSGHEVLAVESLRVLEKLSLSRKLLAAPGHMIGPSSVEKSKIVGIVEHHGDDYRIAKSLATAIEFSMREWEAGPFVPAYQYKLHILDFLLNGLRAISDKVGLAHILLGFSSSGTGLTVNKDGLFASGKSLFHAILDLAHSYPATFPDSEAISGWMVAIRSKCFEIIRCLWRSPFTSLYVMTELRAVDFGFAFALQNLPVSQLTVWDDLTFQNQPDFFLHTSVSALASFLTHRAIFYDYCARELRVAQAYGMSDHLERLQGMLLGMTTYSEEEPTQTLSIFELFDFVELEMPGQITAPALQFFSDLDFSICEKTDAHAGIILDVDRVREMVEMRKRELTRSGHIDSANEEAALMEISRLIAYAHASNGLASAQASSRDALKSWIALMTVFLEVCELTDGMKTQFILQAFKVITPKLEKSIFSSLDTATALIGACQPLLKHVDADLYDRFRSSGDSSNNMLFQLFRVAISGIINIDSTAELRGGCEQVAYVYLRDVIAPPEKDSESDKDGSAESATRASRELVTADTSLMLNITRALQLNVDRLVETLCDDIQSGPVMSRIPAVLLLDVIIQIGHRQKTDFVIDAMIRLNFPGLLVDCIKEIPRELEGVEVESIPQLLLCYNTILSLLLRVCSTKTGASHVISIGLFSAIRESAIFSTDPDIGTDIENPHALRRFFLLMLALMRIINVAVISRGIHNERVLQLAREFLTENRSSMVSILKRRAGIGRAMSLLDGTLKPGELKDSDKKNAAAKNKKDKQTKMDDEDDKDEEPTEAEKLQKKDREMIYELVDHFVVLMTITDFVEFEDTLVKKQIPTSLFS